MKKIIQRNLNLNTKYKLVKITYSPLIDSQGCTCDNCGRLISNIATVQTVNDASKPQKETHFFNIGTDCLETILLASKLLVNDFEYKFEAMPALGKAKALRAKILNAQKKDSNFSADLYRSKDKPTFGFSFSTIKASSVHRQPQGFDFTFNVDYFELTLNYIKDLPNVNLQGF